MGKLSFLRRLRAAWSVLFGRVSAPPIDAYYAKEHLAPWRGGQSISPAKPLNVPAVWRSSEDHVIAYLAYISADEAQLLAAIDLHGSGVREKMHFGPLAIPSYQGDGSSGGDGGGGDGGGDSGGDSGEGDSGDDSDDDSGFGFSDDYGANQDVGFSTPDSILSEANYGVDPYGADPGEADPGSSPPSPDGPGSGNPQTSPFPGVNPATLLGTILTAPPPPEMPMPENASARLARRRSARAQSRRRGRGATILSSINPLGGQ